MHIRMLVAGCLVLLGAILPMRASATSLDSRWGEVGLGVEVANGTYGTDVSTTFITVPLTITLFPTDRLDVEAVVPWVRQSNSSTAYRVAQPIQTMSATTAGTVIGAMQYGSTRSSGSFGSGSGTSGSTITTAEAGLGDCTLTLGYRVLDEGDYSPQLRLTFFGKLPTADRDKGLGTGEFDFGPGFTAGKWFGDWQPFAEAKYVIQGKSDLFATRNYLNYAAGLAYQVSETAMISVAGKGASSPASGAPAPIEGRIKLQWQLTQATLLETYVSRGFTNGSPDWGGGLSLFVSFGG